MMAIYQMVLVPQELETLSTPNVTKLQKQYLPQAAVLVV